MIRDNGPVFLPISATSFAWVLLQLRHVSPLRYAFVSFPPAPAARFVAVPTNTILFVARAVRAAFRVLHLLLAVLLVLLPPTAQLLGTNSAVSVDNSMLRVPPWRNRWLLAGVAFPSLLHLAVLYLPGVGELFVFFLREKSCHVEPCFARIL